MTQNIVLIGCGRLGHAMLSHWLEKMPLARFIVLELKPNLDLLDLAQAYGARIAINPVSAFVPDIAVIAVKPQTMADALTSMQAWLPPTCLVVSVAAGIRLAALEKSLGDGQPIVRAMPNVAALVGEAATVCVANSHAGNEHLNVAKDLMEAIGTAEWVSDEALLDAVTAVSGSGPGFVFLFLEELTRAGVSAGLPENLSMRLARQTLVGVGALLGQSAQDAGELRNMVASPGGTTEAGLGVLMKDGVLRNLLQQTVQAAATRANELSK